MWKFYAILSAVFAALTAVLAKIGVKDVNSNLATFIRTIVILVITWGCVFFSGHLKEMKNLSSNTWIFLILSGVATGLSWLCYFKALQMGDASRVAPIDKLSVVFVIILSILFLKEPFNWRIVLGGILIAAGSIVIAWK